MIKHISCSSAFNGFISRLDNYLSFQQGNGVATPVTLNNAEEHNFQNQSQIQIQQSPSPQIQQDQKPQVNPPFSEGDFEFVSMKQIS